MAKLFALEEMDESGAEVELEASPEVGEVADVQTDMVEDMGGVEDQSEAITEGVEAADQLGEVEDVVASAAEGEGLDPVAAESIRIAVEAICSRIGANPKAIYSLYATENFQSASSRKANSKIALEGVGEFLKDLWKKIKAALTNMWTKIKAFWEKHVSSLGRIKKALDSMKIKVSESSGKLKDKAYLDDAPSGLSDAFGGGELSVKSFDAVIANHTKMMDSAADIATVTASFNASAGATVTDIAAAINKLTYAANPKTGVLVGGVTIEYKFEKDAEEGTVTFEVERETADTKDKGGVSLTDKAGLKKVLDDMTKLIADNIKAKEKMTKLNESFNKFAMNVEKAINDSAAVPADAKKMRNAMKIAYKINAKVPSLANEALGLNVKLAKVVLSYTGLCLKHYK